MGRLCPCVRLAREAPHERVNCTQKAVAWPPPRNACCQGRRVRGFLEAMVSSLEECVEVETWVPFIFRASAGCFLQIRCVGTVHCPLPSPGGKCRGHCGEGHLLLCCPGPRAWEGQNLLIAPFYLLSFFRDNRTPTFSWPQLPKYSVSQLPLQLCMAP